jgi:hypothetical protein
MLRQSPSSHLDLLVSGGSYPVETSAVRAATHAGDRSAARSSRLHDHMVRDHGRSGREINGLPLADLHRFEHVEQAMGLNDLGHQHPADGLAHRHVPTGSAEAPIDGAHGHRP